MTDLVRLTERAGKIRAHVIFVHGLGGHAYETWAASKPAESLWPRWLAQDVPGVHVWTLSYAAPATNWIGNAMPLQDRAVNVLERLLAQPILSDAPILFVCHSLGGLLIKQVLRQASDQQSRRPEARALLGRVVGVAFIATPHTGSTHATWLDRLRLFLWPSTAAQVLVRNDPHLRDLNLWYRGWSSHLQHLVFYETRGTAAGTIVDAGSADAGLPNVVPIPLDADHVDICKCTQKDDLLFQRTRDFVAAATMSHRVAEADLGEVRDPALPSLAERRGTRLQPAAIVRLVALLLLVFVVARGVQAIASSSPPLSQADADQLALALGDKFPELSIEQRERMIDALRDAPGNQMRARAIAEAERGNLHAARGLWRQLFDDMEKEQRAARKLQASAARNYAALAVGDSAAEALRWYEKATALDPDDLDGWIAYGDAAVTAGTLEQARTAYEAAVRIARERRNAWEEGRAYNKVGNVLVAEGKLSDARTAYQDSHEIAKRLSEADRSNADRQRDLAVSYDKLGNVLVAEGKLSDARKAYEDALEIDKRLAEADRSNAARQRDLSVSYERLGDVFVAEGKLSDARKAYEVALEIRKRLAEADRSNADRQRDLAVSYGKLAVLEQRQGRSAQGRERNQQAAMIMRQLVEVAPDHAGWRQDLAYFQSQLKRRTAR